MANTTTKATKKTKLLSRATSKPAPKPKNLESAPQIERCTTGKTVQMDADGSANFDIIHPAGAGWFLRGQVVRENLTSSGQAFSKTLYVSWVWERFL